jgi:hypothetical protein
VELFLQKINLFYSKLFPSSVKNYYPFSIFIQRSIQLREVIIIATPFTGRGSFYKNLSENDSRTAF